MHYLKFILFCYFCHLNIIIYYFYSDKQLKCINYGKKNYPCRRICTNKANVPADLQSAGIEYKDFQSACFL